MAVDFEKIIIEHEGKIGKLTEAVDTIKGDVTSVFRGLDEVKELTKENNKGIELLVQKIENGLINKLEEIKETIEDIREKQEKKDDQMMSEMKNRININEKEKMTKITKGLENLENDSWIIKILSMGTKKALTWIFTIIITAGLLIGIISNIGWYTLKTQVLRETPGLVQDIAEATKVIYHSHKISEDEIVIHSGHPESSCWRINLKANTSSPLPEARTEDGFQNFLKNYYINQGKVKP